MKTSTPVLIAQECVIARVRILNRIITNMYDTALRPFGVKSSQMNILVVTGTSDSTTPGNICKRLKMEVSTVSRNVERMRARGWIETIEDHDDGRAHSLKLTEEGRRMIERVKPAWEETQERVKELLGPTCVRSLMTTVQRIAAR